MKKREIEKKIELIKLQLRFLWRYKFVPGAWGYYPRKND